MYENLLSEYKDYLTKPTYKSFVNYIRGVSSEIRSFSVLGNSDLLGISYDKQDYFISRGRWDERSINRHRITNDLGFAGSEKVNLIIDDSATRKFNQTAFYVSKGYIGNMGKVDWCMSAVYSCFSNGNEIMPFDFEMYLSASKMFGGRKNDTFRSKLQLAQSLINRAFFLAKEQGIQIGYVLFDAWYSSSWMLNTLNRGGANYLTEIRSNRVAIVNDRKLAVNCLVTAFPGESQTISDNKSQRYEIRSYLINIKDVDHSVKLFEIKGRFCGRRQTRYFVTNNIDTTAQQAVTNGTMRWGIDYFFREVKARLAFDEGKFQKLRCYIRHFYLCFIAWSMIRRAMYLHLLGNSQTIFAAVRLFRKHFA